MSQGRKYLFPSFRPDPSMAERIVGTTKVTAGWKITLLKDVVALLEKGSRDRVEVGDTIVFFVNERGDVLIRRA